MLTFLAYLREGRFKDIEPTPVPGHWEHVPTDVLVKAKQEPHTNIDDELFTLIAQSYANIGGYPDFKQADDLPGNHTEWYANDVDGDDVPDAVGWGKKTPRGNKWTGLATDGTPDAKRAAIQELVKNLRTPGNYCETSHRIMEILLLRYNVPSINDAATVQAIINKPIRWVGKHPEGLYPRNPGFYVRDLFGKPHMKILLGTPR